MPTDTRKWYQSRAGVEAICTLLLGLLALTVEAFYSGQSLGNREVVLLVLTILASCGIYYVRRPGFHLGSKQAIEDLLSVAGIALGPSYRLNVMRLKHHRDEAERTFGFVCHFNMQDLHKYDGKLRLSTPGVGQAYMDRKVVHLGPSNVDASVDAYAKQVWSAHVESGRNPRCVLNIDTNREDLDVAQIEHVSNVIGVLAKLVAKQNPGRLPILE